MVMQNFTALFFYISLNLVIISRRKSATYIATFDFTTKESPITSKGVTARVKVMEGTVALRFLHTFSPRTAKP